MSVLIYGLAADKVETQAQHSFSALMKAHEQLPKTSVERKMSRYNGRIFMTDVVGQRQFFKWTERLQMR